MKKEYKRKLYNNLYSLKHVELVFFSGSQIAKRIEKLIAGKRRRTYSV